MTLSLVVDADKYAPVTETAVDACNLAKEAEEQLKETLAIPGVTREQIAEAEQVMRAAQTACERADKLYRQIPHEADAFRVKARIETLW